MEKILTPLTPQQGRSGKMEYFCKIGGKATIVNAPIQGEGIKFAYIEITRDLGRLQFGRVVQWVYPLPINPYDLDNKTTKEFIITGQHAMFCDELPNCPKIHVLIGRGAGDEKVYMKHKDGVASFSMENFPYLRFDKEGFLFTDRHKNAGYTSAYIDDDTGKAFWATNYKTTNNVLVFGKHMGEFLDNDEVEIVWTEEMEANHFTLEVDLKHEIDRGGKFADLHISGQLQRKSYVVAGDLPKGKGEKSVKIAEVNGLYVLSFNL